MLERVVVIEASAGTGKTFQLSNRYLALLAHGVEPDSILATTFTRAAAGEIRERILLRLARAVRQKEEAAALAEQMGMADFAWPRACRMLEDTARRLHRLRISTLDSFFGQLARSLSLELNLPPEWDVVEPSASDPLLDAAIRLTLQQEDSHDLDQLFYRIQKGEAARSIADVLRRTVADFLAAYEEAPDEDAWTNFPSLPRLTAKKLQEIADALSAYESAEADGADRRLQKAVWKDAEYVRAQDWENLLKSSVFKAVADGGDPSYYRRPIPGRVVQLYRPLVRHVRATVLDELRSATHATYELLRRFSAHYDRVKRRRGVFEFSDVPVWLRRAWQEPWLRQTAFRLDTPIRHLLLDEFQDTSLLQWWVLEPFVREVTVPTTDDRRAMTRTCDPRRCGTFFCVGDSKQAIYRWRGGRAGILQAVPELLPEAQRKPLTKSFRSSGAVIDAVNRLCGGLAEGARASGADDALLEAAERWVQNFPEHTAHHAGRPGYAAVEVAVPEDQTEAANGVLTSAVARRVRELFERCPDHTIGVLVRKNMEVATVTFHLRRLGVPCSELGGNPLTDAAPVEAILSALQLATHPQDTVARYHVTHSPLAAAAGLPENATSADVNRWAVRLRRRLQYEGYDTVLAEWTQALWDVCTQRERLRLSQLVRFAGSCGDAPLRPDAFVEVVREQRMPDPTTDRVCVMTVHQAKGLQFDVVVFACPEQILGQPGHGVPYVTQQRSPTAPIERVCVYRGQQVQDILPDDLRQMFRDDRIARITEELNLLYVGLTRAAYALHVVVTPQSRNSRAKAARWLCGGLGIDIPKPADLVGDDGDVASPGDRPPTQTLWEIGDPHWHAAVASTASTAGTAAAHGASQKRKAKKAGEAAKAEENGERAKTDETEKAAKRSATAEARSSGESRDATGASAAVSPAERSGGPARETISFASRSGRRRAVTIESPSDVAAADYRNPRGLLGFFEEASTRGTVMHRWCELVGWLDESTPADEELLDAVRAELPATIDENRLRRWLEEWRGRMSDPAVAAVFSRDHYCGPQSPFPPEIRNCLASGEARLELYREMPFVVSLSRGIVRGAIDRLVIVRSADGQAHAADIIDFKTDAVVAGDRQSLQQHVERYAEQLRLYRQAVARLFGIPAEAISCRLMFLETGDIVAV